MELRDVAAFHALVGLLSSGRFNGIELENISPVLISNTAYDLADAMLHSRKFPAEELK